MTKPVDDGKVETTWVPALVERAIRDLIPDTGHAREIARSAWKWDAEHPGYENALYRWVNEAIRQRRDVIALQLMLDRLATPVGAPEERQQWISVEDRLPEEGNEVLITDGGGIYLSQFQPKSYSCYWDCDTFGLAKDNITHWMPLPPLPVTRKETP